MYSSANVTGLISIHFHSEVDDNPSFNAGWQPHLFKFVSQCRQLLKLILQLIATPAIALDLNAFRAQHKLPPLCPSAPAG